MWWIRLSTGNSFSSITYNIVVESLTGNSEIESNKEKTVKA